MGATTPSLGDQLRRLRGETTLRELARRTGIDHTTLSRYESGIRRPSADHVALILDGLGVEDPEREQLLVLVRRDAPGELVVGVPSIGRQLAQLMGYERAATRITEIAPFVIPGLLQTPGYAQAVLSGGSDIDRRVKLRMDRAEIINRPNDPVELRAIIHMEALTRPVAPASVIRAQLGHLLRMARLPNVTIQLVQNYDPWWMPCLAGSFIVIELAEETPVVHIEHYRSGAFIWAAEEVRSYAAAAEEIAQKAMTPAHTVKVLAEMEEST
jgi:transcriptional regulator with XRE-family HTH domain